MSNTNTPSLQEQAAKVQSTVDQRASANPIPLPLPAQPNLATLSSSAWKELLKETKSSPLPAPNTWTLNANFPPHPPFYKTATHDSPLTHRGPLKGRLLGMVKNGYAVGVAGFIGYLHVQRNINLPDALRYINVWVEAVEVDAVGRPKIVFTMKNPGLPENDFRKNVSQKYQRATTKGNATTGFQRATLNLDTVRYDRRGGSADPSSGKGNGEFPDVLKDINIISDEGKIKKE
jgi:hypothetical protein